VALDEAGQRLEVNAERHLKAPTRWLRLYRDAPEALTETQAFWRASTSALDQLTYIYPDEPVPPGGLRRAGLKSSSGAMHPSAILKAFRTRLKGF
jgi:DNA polymerase III alpha subunit